MDIEHFGILFCEVMAVCNHLVLLNWLCLFGGVTSYKACGSKPCCVPELAISECICKPGQFRYGDTKTCEDCPSGTSNSMHNIHYTVQQTRHCLCLHTPFVATLCTIVDFGLMSVLQMIYKEG